MEATGEMKEIAKLHNSTRRLFTYAGVLYYRIRGNFIRVPKRDIRKQEKYVIDFYGGIDNVPFQPAWLDSWRKVC